MPTDDVKVLSEEVLTELSKLEREATAGPWRSGRSDMVSWLGSGDDVTDGPFKNIYGPDKEPVEVVRAYRNECVANAQLVATLRNAAPLLLASARRCASLESRVAELEAENERLKAGKEHCSTCICGRRAPVQSNSFEDGPERKVGVGTIAWSEHLRAWSAYDAKWRSGQTAERLAERGGFGYNELTRFLGHEPKTWEPKR